MANCNNWKNIVSFNKTALNQKNVYESVDGISYENIGIPPDYPLDYDSNSVQFYTLLENKEGIKDDAIEMVLEMIKKNK